ncbi:MULTISPECIES: DUF4017 family protein [Bacillus cereus group]|uniref:DUF4017 domain-containing protein n=1 Tax=Bacillus cereus TaxID=1396 RepID=A0A2A8PYA5_BACCE|nr:DUF4017 family protein [Bacillus cereus]EJS68826.1 hypothetical protein ICU_02379 [Bacillus cereus BAG2X1-1]EJS76352.1 hypothetical protein ICY_02222 [Bacillus cereus BAG2X1-3]PEA09591.1 DUF4017 domain-containing protein [Bacillus cereus]PEW02958.1 DUF4017 domain-containing protein [Bacillus cereus]PEX83358.1 DUF4017 domain-containing protein [Bacillus cereus]
MKNIIPALFVYFIVCIISVLIPASDGYNTVGWKLFVGQIYAIPIFLITAIITFYMNKKRSYE